MPESKPLFTKENLIKIASLGLILDAITGGHVLLEPMGRLIVEPPPILAVQTQVTPDLAPALEVIVTPPVLGELTIASGQANSVPETSDLQIISAEPAPSSGLLAPTYNVPYLVRKTNPVQPWGIHGSGDYEARGRPPLEGTDFRSQALFQNNCGGDNSCISNLYQPIFAPFDGEATFQTHPQDGNYLILIGENNWQNFVFIVYHIQDGVNGEVQTGQRLAKEEPTSNHTHQILLSCREPFVDNQPNPSCVNVPILSVIRQNDWPLGTFTYEEVWLPFSALANKGEFFDAFLPQMSRLWIPSGAVAPDWDNWPGSGQPGKVK